MKRILAGAVLLGGLIGCPAGAAVPIVKVGEIQSAQDCTAYVGWGGRLATQCRAQFPDLRANLQSMLLASGRIGLSSNVSGHDLPAPDLVVTGRVTGLGLTASKASGPDYCVGGTRAVASLDLRVRDAHSGAILFGGNVTKSVALSSNIVAGGARCGTMTPDDASYDRVEGALALVAARTVLFHVAPLRVTGISGRRIALNYGTPILTLGTIVQVTGAGGFPLRYQVVAATAEAAFADPDGEAGPIAPGTLAQLIEEDDPAANARRTERVELP